MSDFPAMHLTQTQKLDLLMSKDWDEANGIGPKVPLPDVIGLGIGPYSRRFEDLRKLYRPMGFDVVNTLERGHDGITRSWYQKIRVGYPQAERPETYQQPKQHRRKAQKQDEFAGMLAKLTERSFHKEQPKPEPEWTLVP